MLTHYWAVRAGLSDPNISLRSVESFCSQFGQDGERPLSRTSVSCARSAFASILAKMNHYHAAKSHGCGDLLSVVAASFQRFVRLTTAIASDCDFPAAGEEQNPAISAKEWLRCGHRGRCDLAMRVLCR